MFSWWYFGLIGCSCVYIIYCGDSDSASMETEEEEEAPSPVVIHMDVDVPSTAPVLSTTTEPPENDTMERLTCFECIDCNEKSEMEPRNCDRGINHCYTVKRQINNAFQVVRRGCSAVKGECMVSPEGDQTDSIDSVTCCSGHECNSADRMKSMMLFSILCYFIANIL